MKQTDSLKLRKVVVLFYITTVFFTWLLWFPAFLIQNHGISVGLSYDFFITAGTFVPSAIGVLFTYIYGGKTELHSLLKSVFNVQISLKWMLFIFLTLPAVSGVSCLVYYISEGTIPQPQFPLWFIPIAFVYILILMGPLGEEAGWRGFALKRLLEHSSPFKASVILGMLWSVWHLPLFFIAGTTQNALTSFGYVPAIFGYFLYTVIISVLITLLYVMTGGSLLGSVLLHTVGNLSLGVVPLIFSIKGAIITILTLAFTVTAIIYKYRKIMFNKIKA